MGYKRQVARRKSRHGMMMDQRCFDRLYEAAEKNADKHVRVVFHDAKCSGLRYLIYKHISDVETVRRVFQEVFGSDCRIVSIKRGSSRRWVKSEHPVARRRRVREEERQKIFGMS